ncbi:FUSC family protein [Chondrinema litorale]|uniref:FUSC family protein n=1 Tax=Chondrinema litorale TaxID=2994555 RepID=UPI0025435D48|nr:FUSC family protein [Chondrinema litorale]UZR96546.1 FUSC family protein [Chondrinema litorale]
MGNSLKHILKDELKSLFTLNQTERLWTILVLASFCVGFPLFAGYYLGNLQYGALACLSGLVILYMPSTPLAHRLITLFSCSFGFMLSFTIGICFSFNPIISSITFGLFSMGVYWLVNYFNLAPPRSFFFIMVASLASCMPFDLASIPLKIGLVSIGTMLACVLGLIYSILIIKKYPPKAIPPSSGTGSKYRYANLIESGIVGFFMFLSLLTGHLLKVQNPYWITISSIAVMQGVSLQMIWQRSFHRIIGTFLGLGLCFVVLSFKTSALNICIGIMVLQFVVEILVTRHYALAVIFITPLTILLNEAANGSLSDPDELVMARFIDTVIGSVLGAIGGWFVHHEQLRSAANKQIQKTKIAIKKMK